MAIPIQLRPITLCEKMGWTEQALRERFEGGQRSFERGYRMVAFSDDEATFPHYKQCVVPGVSIGPIQRSEWPKFTGVDLSSKKRPGNCIFTAAVDPLTKRRYAIDVRFGAWRGNETCEQISEVNSLYNPSVIVVEDNGYQETLIDWAQASKSTFKWWMKVEPTTTTGQKKRSEEQGLPALEVEFARKGWVFPLSEWEGATPEDPGLRGFWARLDKEFRHHPIAANTDGVMACWFARQGIELYGGLNVSEPLKGLGDINIR